MQQTPKKTRTKQNPVHYVNNAELYEKFKRWMYDPKFNKEDKPRPPDDILLDAWKIINGYISKSKFYNIPPEIREECAPLALEFCIKYLYNFDIEKYKNPFSYITTYAHNAICECFRKDRKEKNGRMLYMTECLASSTYLRSDGEIDLIASGDFAIDQIKYIEDARMYYEKAKLDEAESKNEQT